MTTLGGRLKSRRPSAGLSQSELEALSGIPEARISRYEHNHVEPSIGTLRCLCKAFGVQPGALLDEGVAA
jgi:transcriptional regulator with XRE-family HTH domain